MLKIELEQSGNALLCRATQRGEELGRAEAEIRRILSGTGAAGWRTPRTMACWMVWCGQLLMRPVLRV